MKHTKYLSLLLLFFGVTSSLSFVLKQPQPTTTMMSRHRPVPQNVATSVSMYQSSSDQQNNKDATTNYIPQRRDVLTRAIGTVCTVFWVDGQSSWVANAATTTNNEDETSSFANIAARANQISKEIDKENAQIAATVRKSEKTAYDFELPVEGVPTKFADLIQQEFYDDGVKVKAILVVNIKQDDPVARKTIPELISLATKYARNRDGAFAVVCCPTYVVAVSIYAHTHTSGGAAGLSLYTTNTSHSAFFCLFSLFLFHFFIFSLCTPQGTRVL
jgi:hypothetical protein